MFFLTAIGVFVFWLLGRCLVLYNAETNTDKIDNFTQRHYCSVVAFSGMPDPFLNINRPEDFAEAKRWFK